MSLLIFLLTKCMKLQHGNHCIHNLFIHYFLYHAPTPPLKQSLRAYLQQISWYVYLNPWLTTCEFQSVCWGFVSNFLTKEHSNVQTVIVTNSSTLLQLMTQDRPHGNLSNSAEILPDAIRRAVAAAAVEPVSSMENMASEIRDNAELHEAFQSQIDNTLSERLESDRDFKSERFPNSEEYYHKSANKKWEEEYVRINCA